MNEPKEGFEVLAELTSRHWRTLEMHADTAANVGPGALLPAVTLPQAQLDIQHAIREAFHAGAAFQASMQPIVMSVQHSAVFDDSGGEPRLLLERIPRLEATLRPRIDLAAVAEQLPRREPNAYVSEFVDAGLQLICPTCHQVTPPPSPRPRTPTHAGPCGAGCDVPAAVAT